MSIKNLIPLILAVVAFTACNHSETSIWEHKIILITENDGLTLQEQTM